MNPLTMIMKSDMTTALGFLDAGRHNVGPQINSLNSSLGQVTQLSEVVSLVLVAVVSFVVVVPCRTQHW